MSLGLNDLKKKSAKPKTENWARSTTTARPWAAAGLSKGPKARKSRAENSDAFMSDEWANDYTSSIHAFDMEVQSALTQLRDLQVSLKEQAVEIERKIKRAAMSPFEIMRSVLQMVQK
jgi:membrane-anchored protein YejM (alkaline phosphatase superfamily)